MRRFIFSALLLASCGQADGSPNIQISDAWARESVAGQPTTAAYMTIANGGSGGDRLVGVTTSAPAVAMVHSTSSQGGISRMRPVNSGLELPAGATTQLAPGGTHVMIMGLPSQLKPGDTLKLTLRFKKSGERYVEVPVRSAI